MAEVSGKRRLRPFNQPFAKGVRLLLGLSCPSYRRPVMSGLIAASGLALIPNLMAEEISSQTIPFFSDKPDFLDGPPQGLGEIIGVLQDAASNELVAPLFTHTAPDFAYPRDPGGMVPTSETGFSALVSVLGDGTISQQDISESQNSLDRIGATLDWALLQERWLQYGTFTVSGNYACGGFTNGEWREFESGEWTYSGRFSCFRNDGPIDGWRLTHLVEAMH